MNLAWISLKVFIVLTCITGLAYPLMITLIAQIGMPAYANGNLKSKENKIVGSKLIAQQFVNPRYFWPRPSSNNYNPLHSGGSGLAWTSPKLQQNIKERILFLSKYHRTEEEIPAELIYASGSGLDPHISLGTAFFQMNRILSTRGLSLDKQAILIRLINDAAEGKFFGILGKKYVNVLELNLILDQQLQKQP